MASKPYSIPVSADFASLVREAQKASSKLTDIFNDAMDKGFKNVNLRDMEQKTRKLVEKEYKLREELELRHQRQRAKEEGRLNDVRREEFKRVLKKQQEVDDALDKESKERLEREHEIAKMRLAVLMEEEESNEVTQKLTSALADTVSELRGLEKNAKQSSMYFNRTAERIGKISKFFRDDLEKGGDTLIDKLTTGMDGLVSKLSSSVDMGSLAKGLGGGASKGLQSLGDALGQIKGIGPTLAKVVGGLGLVIAGFGIFLGLMFDIDKKVKEFNKTAIGTFGSLELAAMGGKDLGANLLALNRTVHDLVGNLGLSQEEATGLLETLSKGGITLREVAKATENATEQQRNFQNMIVKVGTTARAMGVGVAEYASNLTDYVNDLSQSLDTVNNSFAQIAKMASDSSFGTRRFYSMVVQASSGQASLNTKLEDTADLLMKMTKVLGQKRALEMAQLHGGDMAGKSTSDRLRMLVQSGGRMKGILKESATAQAGTFATGANVNSMKRAFSTALIDAHLSDSLTGAITDARSEDAATAQRGTQQLVDMLGRMGGQDATSVVAALTNSADEETQHLGQRLDQLIETSRGAEGNLAQQTIAMGNLGPRGSIMGALAAVEGTTGTINMDNPNDVKRLVALENISGYSAQQVSDFRKLIRTSDANYRELQRFSAKVQRGQALSDSETKHIADAFHATIDASGQIRQQGTGRAITSGRQFLAMQDQQAPGALAEAMSQQESLMASSFSETVSIGDILENKIYQVLLSLYSVVSGPMTRAIAKLAGVDTTSVDMSSAITKKMTENSTAMSAAQRSLAEITQKVQTTGPGAERSEWQAKKVAAEKQLTDLRDRNQRLSAARERIQAGNTYDYRGGYEATVATGRDTQLHAGADIGGGAATTNQRFGSYDEAKRAGTNVREVRLTEAQMLARLEGAGGGGVPPTAMAPTPTPTNANPTPANAAPVRVAPSAMDTNPVQTDRVSTAVTNSSVAQTDNANANHNESQNLADQRHRDLQQHLTRVLTRETKLGDALARSKLPDAIVEAQLKQQLMAAGTAAGLDPEHAAAAAAKFLQEGTLTDDFRAALNAHAEIDTLGLGVNRQDLNTPGRHWRMAAQAANNAESDEPPVEDFIYRGNGVRGSITPIDTADQFFGARPGGAIDKAVGGNRGGGTFNVHIHGGDERRVYDVVRRVMQQSGIAPSRVGSNA